MPRHVFRWLRALQQISSRWLVARSGLFDAKYYLEEYPDVAAAGMVPSEHYCKFGWREGRRPGPMVHTDYVSAGPIGRHFARFNPIIIWLLLGRWVGWSLTWPQLRGWTLSTPHIQADIAFVLHTTTRTGAPICALRLARWMRRKDYADPIFILLADGALLPEIWNEFPCLPLFAMPKSQRRSCLQATLPRTRVVYLNSLASLRAWQWLDWYRGGLVLHVHESAASIDQYASDLTAIALAGPRTIAVNESCKAPLTQMLGQAPDIVPPAIEFTQQHLKGSPPTARKIVVGCGTMSLRKGADLFCQVAAQLLEKFDDEVEFRWLGGVGDVDMKGLLKRYGISRHVKLMGEVSDPLPYLATASLFMLPSRDDPFPLVAMEAASCGVPVVCFDVLTDGVGTWISRGAGDIIPAFDICAMADSIIQFLIDPVRLASAGTFASKAAEQFDIDKIGDRIGRIIDQVVEESVAC